ncbi:MAG TPA: hypothetical protein VGK18_05100 [Propionicimonas sp.]|jgi:hypothetical protein|uniref:hypothetical protein n=1 Tax=Propionicimonas sp. TaxID=1955623 RepID=UPI002F41B142
MRDRSLLVVAVSLALVFSVSWLWRAAGDEATPRTPVAAGETGRLGAVTYRLVSLQAVERATTLFDDAVVPVQGAVLVLARIDYDAVGTSTFFACTFELVAGETTWRSEFGYSPPEPDSSTCDRNAAGRVAVLFEIPAHMVNQVQGVGVTNPTGAEPLLVGRPT